MNELFDNSRISLFVKSMTLQPLVFKLAFAVITAASVFSVTDTHFDANFSRTC